MRVLDVWRLRKLQRRYYDSPEKNDAAAGEYLRALAELRGTEQPPLVCVHVGSGGHTLDGWINVDLEAAPPLDLATDAAAALPFRSESVDRIHSEDFIEHVEYAAGKQFLAEAFRVLKPGGIMRLLTPDLRAIVQRVYLDREPRHLRWCGVYLDAPDPCEALNMHLRMNGEHRFLYDEPLLRRVLNEAGFGVRRVRWNRSPDRWLRYLDLRDFGLNLFLECVKPSPSSSSSP
jgi:predicted SAM-dependent methyltransferase